MECFTVCIYEPIIQYNGINYYRAYKGDKA